MKSISVVAMPWASPETPSIQIGILTAVAERAGLPVNAYSLQLEAAGYFAGNGAPTLYDAVVRRWWRVG
ncbi:MULTISPECIES: hypothetical protein [unclassified Frankia]